MKLTNEQINALSDPEVNVMMQICISGAVGYKPNSSMRTIYTRHDDSPSGLHVITVEDCCNDHAVMMPIVFESKINLISPVRNQWSASCNEGGGKWSIDEFAFHHENPLRAAAIVYLKSKGVL